MSLNFSALSVLEIALAMAIVNFLMRSLAAKFHDNVFGQGLAFLF